jgi:hypothetical protein
LLKSIQGFTGACGVFHRLGGSGGGGAADWQSAVAVAQRRSKIDALFIAHLSGGQNVCANKNINAWLPHTIGRWRTLSLKSTNADIYLTLLRMGCEPSDLNNRVLPDLVQRFANLNRSA